MSVIHLNDSNFEGEIKKSEIPCIVDFFAEWCGPCKMLAPVFEEVSAKYEGKCNFFKLNVDDNSTIAAKFSVMSIPTLIFFENGEKKASTMGAISADELANFVENNL